MTAPTRAALAERLYEVFHAAPAGSDVFVLMAEAATALLREPELDRGTLARALFELGRPQREHTILGYRPSKSWDEVNEEMKDALRQDADFILARLNEGRDSK